jgi:hypothetical protein
LKRNKKWKRNKKLLKTKQSAKTLFKFCFGGKQKRSKKVYFILLEAKKNFAGACETHAKQIWFRFVLL